MTFSGCRALLIAENSWSLVIYFLEVLFRKLNFYNGISMEGMCPFKRLCKMMAFLLVYENLFKVLVLTVSCTIWNSLLLGTLNCLCTISVLCSYGYFLRPLQWEQPLAAWAWAENQHPHGQAHGSFRVLVSRQQQLEHSCVVSLRLMLYKLFFHTHYLPVFQIALCKILVLRDVLK